MKSSRSNRKFIPFRFKVSGNLIRKLGGESISNKNVALLELIKNSYDAKAKKVEVDLKEINTTNASIIISDNGLGMSHTDLESNWMTIATSNKSKNNGRENEGRVIIGEKGLGRLASESLGKKTILTTLPQNETKGYSITFAWDKFQEKNALCNEVINEGYEFEKAKKEHGTKLEIQDLNHDWNNTKTRESLLKDIYLLNPPNKKPKEFTVVPKLHIEFKNVPKINKRFLDKAAYCLKTKLTGGNVIRYEFSVISKKKVRDIISLDGHLTCGDAVFELFFYYKDPKALKNALKVEMSKSDKKIINDTLESYHGIKIYRDNFRVKPYGEPGNDWAGVDVAAQNLSIFPRNVAIFGMVHISKSKNPHIIDTTTREGVIATDAFFDLIKFVNISLSKIFVNLRSEQEPHKKKARKKKAQKKRVEIPENGQTVTAKSKLIDVKGEYPQSFYYKLEEEINNCYEAGFPNATLFLCRKLEENLFYDILQKKFPNNKELWWDKDHTQPCALSPLIKNLGKRKDDFKPNVKKYIEKAIPLAKKLRDNVNPVAHNIYDYLDSRADLEKFKINDLTQLLINIYTRM